jgi:hypothetical protein
MQRSKGKKRDWRKICERLKIIIDEGKSRRRLSSIKIPLTFINIDGFYSDKDIRRSIEKT